MNLTYAVDRLYEVGWLPTDGTGSDLTGSDLERLNDGRSHPSVSGVQRSFGRAGLKLAITPKAKFKCFEATWCPVDEQADPRHASDDRHGTVVGTCEREAAVYALAQLLATRAEVALAAPV